MAEWFDESLLDDPDALARGDGVLRQLAEAGARVRREAVESAESVEAAVASLKDDRPRTVIAAGPDSRLLRAVLEPSCPVPFVAWPHPGLPGWAGTLDLVVVLAPDGSDPVSAAAVAEAVRRGSQVVVACPPDSLVARHAAGRHVSLLPATSGDQLATAVVALQLLSRVDLGPETDPEQVAVALDDVAVSCSPHRDLAVNPAKMLAIAIADVTPLFWGGSVLAARAARRVAESVRRSSGRTALAGDAEHLLPVVAAAPVHDVFEDPFADQTGDPGEPVELRPALVVLDDGTDEPAVHEQRRRLTEEADRRGVRVEALTGSASGEVARYASLMSQGRYAAAYLGLGLGRLGG
ncbi:MAG TPA: SIS domain-containing protein [Marmoricola sp.]|nr:SIS domain-containing protein [Marmoricola sp.]